MLTPKENYLLVLNHQKPEYLPCGLTDVLACGFGSTFGPWIEKGKPGGGYDGFGVRWIPTASGGGQSIPAPNEFLLKDITEWKKKIKFPNLSTFEWEEAAKADFVQGDRNTQVVEFGCGNGIFERLASLMGFEEALISLATEPEACDEFFKALTDYKIDFAEKVAKHYKPDVFCNYDDIATERGTFMSPDTYRALIKPHHKRLYDAVKALGMIPIQHTCGKAEALIEDFIDTGIAVWSMVQPTNDIVSILGKYDDKIALSGGYNSNGRPGMLDSLPEERRAEVFRCINTYGHLKGYIFFGFVIVDFSNMEAAMREMGPIVGAFMDYRMGGATK